MLACSPCPQATSPIPNFSPTNKTCCSFYDDADAYTLLLHGLSPSFLFACVICTKKVSESFGCITLPKCRIHSFRLFTIHGFQRLSTSPSMKAYFHMSSHPDPPLILYFGSFFYQSIILVRPCAFKKPPGKCKHVPIAYIILYRLSLYLLSLRIVNFQCRLTLAPSVPHM